MRRVSRSRSECLICSCRGAMRDRSKQGGGSVSARIVGAIHVGESVESGSSHSGARGSRVPHGRASARWCRLLVGGRRGSPRAPNRAAARGGAGSSLPLTVRSSRPGAVCEPRFRLRVSSVRRVRGRVPLWERPRRSTSRRELRGQGSPTDTASFPGDHRVREPVRRRWLIRSGDGGHQTVREFVLHRARRRPGVVHAHRIMPRRLE